MRPETVFRRGSSLLPSGDADPGLGPAQTLPRCPLTESPETNAHVNPDASAPNQTPAPPQAAASAAARNPAARPPASGWLETLRRLGPAGPMALIASTLPPLGSIVLFWKINELGAWLRGHEGTGIALYTLGFAVLAGIALLPTYASAILGGWAFGFAHGFPAAMAGFGGAAVIGYLLGRAGSKDRVEKIIAEHPKWQAVRDALIGGSTLKTFAIVSLLRLPPNSPFALNNLIFASVRVPLPTFVLGTLVGMAPRTGLVVFIASTLRNKLAEEAASEKPWWLIPVGIGLTLVVFAILGVIAKHAIERVTRTSDGRAAPAPAAPSRGS